MNGDANGKTVKRSTSTKGRMQVALLDDTVVAFDVDPRNKADELYKKVNTHLNLDEPEFFGLLFLDEHKNQTWLDHLKPISKQVREPSKVTFKFRVLFYTPDPNSLQEYTRYLFTLQVRRDLLDGRLHCSQDTGALLASFIVQGELGDYDPLNHQEGYLAGFQFVPNQTPEIEEKIVKYHESHKGESPALSDHNMLEIARQLEMYGITLYAAQDGDGVELSLAVYHSGILVFRDKHKINNFSWANIRKLSFKKKRFLIKLHRTVGEDSVVSFNMTSRNGAKSFWKVCINHHVFFRHSTAPSLKKKASMRRGSKYRYSGRTKKEITEEASTKYQTSSLDGNHEKTSARMSGSFLKDHTQQHSHVADITSPHPPFDGGTMTRQISEDEGSFSIASEPHSPRNYHRVTNDESSYTYDDNYLLSSDTHVNQQNIITMKHQDTIDSNEAEHSMLSVHPPPYNEVMNGSSASYHSPHHKEGQRLGDSGRSPYLVDETYNTGSTSYAFTLDTGNTVTPSAPPHQQNGHKETRAKTADGDDISLDATVNITSTDRELEDEVTSVFQKITSEYGSKSNNWQYNISSVTTDDLHSDDEDERKQRLQCAEADTCVNRSDKTEADEDTEAELRDRVKALYLQRSHGAMSYDSDSDASAITVEDEGSAFEDDLSRPCSATSSVSSIHKGREEYLHELRKYRSNGKIYYIAKEMLQTERTYVKDLEVLTVSFREVVEKDDILPNHLLKLLYDNIDPLYDFHCSLLAELEERITMWENVTTTEATRDSVQKIGDIMHRNMRQIKLYSSYIQKHGDIIMELEKHAKQSPQFEKAYKEFELGKVCYLSVNSFLLKPVQRLLYYRFMLEKLTKEYGKADPDAIDAKVAYEEVVEACKQVEDTMINLENLHKLVELERDLVGIEELCHQRRVFIREGCLHKICRKGPQPRMFFLLSDILLYTSQGVTATNQFRARAQLPLRSLKVEEGGVELHGLYAFTIIGPGNKTFVVAASSPEEKQKWLEDIRAAIKNSIKMSICSKCQANKTEFILQVGEENSHMCSNCQAELSNLSSMGPEERLKYWQSRYPQLPVIKRPSLDTDSDDEGSYSMNEQYSSLDRRHARSRTISTRRVCWHRNTSISMKEYTLSIQNSISGELFRRYKNTTKWQKLWVVFTNFCLYFFKNSDDEAPLASLPLIGYTIYKPTETEVHEDFAFKLQFKTHQYFFRSENEYTFERWFEVLSSATRNSAVKSRRMLGSVS